MYALSGKTLIITGASHGIGHALAIELAGEGVNLVLNARTPGPLENAAEECRKLGANIEWVAGSTASSDVAERLVQKALESGSFYGFVHAAGVLLPGPKLWELPEDSFREIFEASVEGGFQLAKAAFPRLGAGGLAVFFGSGAAEHAVPGIGAYCAAKAAEEHLSRQLAAEAPWITTFAYRPGGVDTRMVRGTFNAMGSAAQSLKERFGGYKREGEIIEPGTAARALATILGNNPARFHGRIATWRDAKPGKDRREAA